MYVGLWVPGSYISNTRVTSDSNSMPEFDSVFLVFCLIAGLMLIKERYMKKKNTESKSDGEEVEEERGEVESKEASRKTLQT